MVKVQDGTLPIDLHGGPSSLNLQVVREGLLVVYPALKGAECRACGAKLVEPAEMELLEQGPLGTQWLPRFDLKVSRIGRGTLGTYWTKEIERNLGLRKDARLRAQILGPRQLLLTVED